MFKVGGIKQSHGKLNSILLLDSKSYETTPEIPFNELELTQVTHGNSFSTPRGVPHALLSSSTMQPPAAGGASSHNRCFKGGETEDGCWWGR